MKGVEFINLEIMKEDERGSIFQVKNRDCTELVLVKRKKDTINGEHYHQGRIPLKNPEVGVLLDGHARFLLKNVKTNEEYRVTYKKPVMFRIDPFIYHEIKALTDIILIEFNSIKDAEADTIKGFPD